jgi:hypothetical protein
MPENKEAETTPAAIKANPSPELSIRSALQAIADQIADGSKLTVSTGVQVIDSSTGIQVAANSVEVARTEISIDGDRFVIVPILLEAGELRVPQAVLDLHERHVSEAVLYRKHMLELLIDFVKTRRLG